jgi:hypothetical protein
MHEATRTFCCRAGFILGALLPTFIVGGWIVVRASPRYASVQEHHWEGTLARTLGLFAEIERVENPRPGEYVLHGVKQIDPDAKRDAGPLLTAKRVHIAERSSGLVILASDGVLASEQLPRLHGILHERLLRGPEVASAPVQLSLNSLKLGAHSLTDVRVQFSSDPKLARSTLEFRLAGSTGEPIRLSIERQRGAATSGTKWSLNTGATPLPCSAISSCLPALSHFGPDSTFHGMCEFTTNDSTFDAAIAGVFEGVDLEKLVTEQLEPHQLSGTAKLTINEAHWRDGKLASAAGELRAKNGTISESLWNAAWQHFQVKLSWALEHQQSKDFGELALAFALDSQALELSGRCHEPSVIVADRLGQALIWKSEPGGVAPIALVHALIPESRQNIPYEGRNLLYLLPGDSPALEARQP